MAEPERALCLPSLPQTPPDGYERLYFGAEFCPWRLPSVADLSEALEWARRVGWHFTLVTPVLIEPARDRLQTALNSLLPALESGDEVLISDWGTLALVRERAPEITVIVGRALSGQKRGPRILDLELSDAQRRYFQAGSWSNRSTVELLGEQGLYRVELDNLLQGLAPLPQGLTGSLHWPYAMVTSSRNCPFRTVAEPAPCPAPCGEVFSLETDQTRISLYQAGNTQFLKHDTLPGDLPDLGITRLVHHPNVPR